MEEILYQEIGKRVKEARLNKDYTQEKLSELIGLTRTSITNIEKGRQKISVHILYNLASSLNILPHELLPHPEQLVKKNNIPISNELTINEEVTSEELEWIKEMITDEKWGEKNENIKYWKKSNGCLEKIGTS